MASSPRALAGLLLSALVVVAAAPGASAYSASVCVVGVCQGVGWQAPCVIVWLPDPGVWVGHIRVPHLVQGIWTPTCIDWYCFGATLIVGMVSVPFNTCPYG